jgi:hypothetical protein
MGLLSDFMRLFKMFFDVQGKKILHKMLLVSVTFLCDVLFFVIAGIVSVLLLYTVGGVFRGVIYPAMGLGFLIYAVTLGRLVSKINIWLAKTMKKAIRSVIRLIALPVRKAVHAIISLYHLTIGAFIGKIIRKIVALHEKKIAEGIEGGESPVPDGGREDFVYVEGKIGYQRNGRISFGRK